MSFWHHLPRHIIGLAPMDGGADIAFRHVLAAEGRPDVIFAEFTNVHDISMTVRITLPRLRPFELNPAATRSTNQ